MRRETWRTDLRLKLAGTHTTDRQQRELGLLEAAMVWTISASQCREIADQDRGRKTGDDFSQEKRTRFPWGEAKISAFQG